MVRTEKAIGFNPGALYYLTKMMNAGIAAEVKVRKSRVQSLWHYS